MEKSGDITTGQSLRFQKRVFRLDGGEAAGGEWASRYQFVGGMNFGVWRMIDDDELGVIEVERFAENLMAHARSEEELLYPAAILVADVLRARSK